jgi:hypothetical protein
MSMRTEAPPTRINERERRTARRPERSLATLATHRRTRRRTMAFLARLSGRDALADAAVLGAAPGAKPRDAPADAALDDGVLGAAFWSRRTGRRGGPWRGTRSEASRRTGGRGAGRWRSWRGFLVATHWRTRRSLARHPERSLATHRRTRRRTMASFLWHPRSEASRRTGGRGAGLWRPWRVARSRCTGGCGAGR